MIWKKQNETVLLEILGEGLTSCVYKAIRKNKTLDVQQVVALKVLHSKNQIQSLKNEIELLLSIDSPYCVKLLGWEETSKGLAIVLEYLDGVLLADLCRYRQLSDIEINEITFQVQEGLKALHTKGIVHGDISLKNIFITREGGVKIIDFGFSTNEKRLCDYGTPQCMSLEAWRGEPLGHGSDLYSLGLLQHVLYEADADVTDARKWQARAEQLKNKNSLLLERADERAFLDLQSNKKAIKNLSEMVAEILYCRSTLQRTQKISSLTVERKKNLESPFKKMMIFGFSFLASMSLSASTAILQSELDTPGLQRWHQLDLRSKNWANVQLFRISRQKKGLYHSGYAPAVFGSLPCGQYELRWTSTKKSGTLMLSLKSDQKIVIDDL